MFEPPHNHYGGEIILKLLYYLKRLKNKGILPKMSFLRTWKLEKINASKVFIKHNDRFQVTK
jgi:hypothetical protein